MERELEERLMLSIAYYRKLEETAKQTGQEGAEILFKEKADKIQLELESKRAEGDKPKA